MVVRAQVLDEVVAARKAIAVLARAVRDRTVLEDRVMDGRLMSLQVGWAGEALAAVVAGVWFGGSGDGLMVEVNRREHGLFSWH